MGETGRGRGEHGRRPDTLGARPAVQRWNGGKMRGPEAGLLAWACVPPAGHGEEAGRQAQPPQHRGEDQGTLLVPRAAGAQKEDSGFGQSGVGSRRGTQAGLLRARHPETKSRRGPVRLAGWNRSAAELRCGPRH
ncbi:hypothetical protein NDU88_006645 [Pleurodeles waltl]|uniref:Uncharacterized protein n=1 Tax=Pleurodeles waltl TaxID=8319 RepID=A0AAV7WGY4_PLEWA|nr:hypothetical protein NDU88_006645 [Pleurodeles waltl]